MFFLGLFVVFKGFLKQAEVSLGVLLLWALVYLHVLVTLVFLACDGLGVS